MEIFLCLLFNFAVSMGSYYYTLSAIKKFAPMLKDRGLFGIDQCKGTQEKIPESLGVISATVFLVQVFCSLPFPFIFNTWQTMFQRDLLIEMLAALLSICCMILLGFADDVLDLKWRHKLILPTVGSLPLLVVYYINFNVTTVVVPKPLRFLLGGTFYLGPLYYVYMGMLAVFCTNAINILAGVNGLEAGQSIVIAMSIIIFNIVEFFVRDEQGHIISLFLMPAFLATTLALFKFNKYPAKVFVGDTFCYFAGMTFACSAILGHFSKAMLLFFIPQIINFIYSVPQLFKIIPCPRHRLPFFNKELGLLSPSTTTFRQDSLSPKGLLLLKTLRILRLVEVVEHKEPGILEMNNLTIINLLLVLKGPLNEGELVRLLMRLQVFSCGVAFVGYYAIGQMIF